MHREDWETFISVTDQTVIIKGITDLAQTGMLRVRAAAKKLPTELAFCLVAMYTDGKREGGLIDTDLTQRSVGFLSRLPLETHKEQLSSIQFLGKLIAAQIKQGKLVLVPSNGRKRIRASQVDSYSIQIGAA